MQLNSGDSIVKDMQNTRPREHIQETHTYCFAIRRAVGLNFCTSG
jgi:hypothetical protein